VDGIGRVFGGDVAQINRLRAGQNVISDLEGIIPKWLRTCAAVANNLVSVHGMAP
jgi:hypothetical protein